MNKFNTIYLFTSTFPYGTGETFLENEMDFITKYCSKVIIIPMDGHYKECNRVNDNIHIEVCNIKIAWMALVFLILKMIVSGEVRDEILRLWRGKKLNIYTIASVVYFWLKGNARICALKKKLKQPLGKNDLLYSYWAGTTLYVALGLKKIYPETRCITRAHRYDVYQERLAPYYIPFQKFMFNKVDGIFPVSDNGLKYLLSRYPFIQGKSIVSYLGTKDNGVNPDKKTNNFRIVSCSNLVKVKRIDKIISALSLMNEDITWIHYGDGEEREYLERLSEKLPGNIHCVFKGRYNNKELMNEYRENHFDLFINVSSSEGLPVSIMEAISFGIPVIATDVGGTSEIINDGYNGYLLDESFTDEELSNLIRNIINMSEDKRKIMRSNSRMLWEDSFMSEKNYEKFFTGLFGI